MTSQIPPFCWKGQEIEIFRQMVGIRDDGERQACVQALIDWVAEHHSGGIERVPDKTYELVKPADLLAVPKESMAGMAADLLLWLKFARAQISVSSLTAVIGIDFEMPPFSWNDDGQPGVKFGRRPKIQVESVDNESTLTP